MLTRDESNALARSAIATVEGYIALSPKAEDRLVARNRLDDAVKCLARDAARAALGHACRAVVALHPIGSPEYARVQAMYDKVYNDHLE